MSTPEFSRIIELKDTERGPVTQELEATEDELLALAERLGLVSVTKLEATMTLLEEAPNWYVAHGSLLATVVQTCIRTLEPLTQELDEDVEVRITSDPSCAPIQEEEVEFGTGDDYEFTTAEEVDVGELVTQALCIALDPYPRKEGAEVPAVPGVEVVWDSPGSPVSAAPPIEEVKNRPFANLAALLEKKPK